jgi:hypothetical protein
MGGDPSAMQGPGEIFLLILIGGAVVALLTIALFTVAVIWLIRSTRKDKE